MAHAMKPMSCNPNALAGLSEKLVVSHYENHYGGAVRRLNAIEETLAAIEFANGPVFSVNGLKREQLIAMSCMNEHFYHLEYRAAAAKYVDAYMQNSHWEEVGSRFTAVQRAASALQEG